MNDTEKLDVIGYGSEARDIEFKEFYDWDDNTHRAKIVKAVLALSNIPSGGYLVFGVRDTDCQPVGIAKALLDKLDQEELTTHINKYADPFADFRFFTHEFNGLHFGIIKVFEFLEIPVVCKRDFPQVLQQGVIYTRPRRKFESVAVPSQTEMREIVELATFKRMQKDIGKMSALLGLAGTNAAPPAATPQGDTASFDKELGGL